MPNLEIDVSHPWDGKNPIRQPEQNPNTLPTEEEIMEILTYFLENEPDLIIPILTEVDMDIFFKEGQSFANI